MTDNLPRPDDRPDVAVVDPGPDRGTGTAPVRPAERVESVDVLRGVALLGILTMNIVSFGWPYDVYENPDLGGGPRGLNRAVWLVNELAFDGKMMSIFSMLFGAGLVLLADRAEARGASALGVYYRRVLWLLAFGLAHAYLIWAGDILYTYAVCGLLLYPLRRLSSGTLIVLGTLIAFVPALIFGAGDAFFALLGTPAYERVEAAKAAGRTPDPGDRWLHETVKETKPNPEAIAREVKTYRGGYRGILKDRVGDVLVIETVVFLVYLSWAALGRMLIGMALMKLGVFAASRSARFYVGLALFGFGVGLPLTAFGAWHQWRHGFDSTRLLLCGETPVYLGSLPVALGYVAVVMLVYRSGRLAALSRRLAAVGRMALTNYLLQSLLCTTLFYGYGLGLFGRLDRLQLYGAVLAVWALQLAISPAWLARYRFGPAEWLWRSLTYGRPQAMHPAAPVAGE
jgi:uncharacterized protein